MNNDMPDVTVKDTETRILRAAEAEFMTKGFAGARTNSIAEAAGVTHAMLHYYFRTKEKLFERIVDDKVAMLRRSLLVPAIESDLPLPELIGVIISQHLDFIAANPLLPRFIIGEIYNNTERSAAFIEKIRTYAPLMSVSLQAKIDAAVAAGECRQTDARMLMLDIASLNIFSFMAAPVVNAALGSLAEDHDAFVAMRKAENYDTIMRKLRP